MRWFQGNIAEAVAASKLKRAVFVVFVEGKDDSSVITAATIDDNLISSQLESDNFVAIKLDSGSESYRQFAQIYQLVPVPSIFFIGTNGAPLEVVAGNVTVPELVLRINTVLEKCGKAVNKESKQPEEEEAAAVASGSGAQQEVQAAPEASKPEPTPTPTPAPAPATSTATATLEPTMDSSPDDASQNLKTVEERVEHAKELLDKKRQQKQEEEERVERNKELDRRRVGQEVQKLKRWQQEQEVQELREQRRKEKMEEQAARQRVLEQISQDKAERAARFAKEQEKEQEVKKEEQRTVERVSRSSEVARIQFRLPDGSSHTHQFPSTASLSEVRSYAASTLSLPFREFAMSTTFPRREFTSSDDNRSMNDLELTPTAVILILPAASNAVVSSPSYINSVTRTFWTLLTPFTALLTFLTSWIFPRGNNRGGSNPPAASPAEAAKTDSNVDKPQPVRRRTAPADNVTVQRQGNVHRLTNRRDSSEDENNTWNGNSTQQM